MPAFTQDPNNHESLRLREVDVLVLACIFAAAIMSLVGLFHSGKPAAPANGTQTAVYYPVGYVAPIAAPVASADITNGPPPGPDACITPGAVGHVPCSFMLLPHTARRHRWLW